MENTNSGAHEPGQDRWPDFGQPLMVLRMLVMGALFSIMLVLSDADNPVPFLVRLGATLLFVEWHILVLSSILVLIGNWLEQQPPGRAFCIVLVVALIMITASNIALFWWSGALERSSMPGEGEPYRALFRNLALGAVFIFAALQYLMLFQRWKAQARA